MQFDHEDDVEIDDPYGPDYDPYQDLYGDDDDEAFAHYWNTD